MAKTSLSKEDFRRLMKERAAKKIESPYAKYDPPGQLNCTLCRTPIKSEAFWTAHVNGKQHVQALNQLNTPAVKSLSKTSEAASLKRPSSTIEVQNKKPRQLTEESTPTELPSDFFDNPKTISKGTSKPPVPADFFDKAPATLPAATKDPSDEPKLLPDNFFDKPNKNTQQKIERDKKAQEEEEWAKFQKEIQEESHKSAVYVEQEDVEARKQRELEEVEEQMERWRRIIDLEKKKETAVAPVGSSSDVKTEDADMNEGQQSDSDDDSDLDFVNWRTRKLF